MRDHVTAIARGLLAVGPHAGAHSAAARAAGSVAVPLLALYAVGRTDLSIYAALGAFTAVYGRDEDYAERVTMQAAAGSTIVVAMLIGTLLAVTDFPPSARVLVVALIAGLVSLLAEKLAWRPSGAMFAVFASGACASIPASGRSFLEILVVGGGAVLTSIFITAVLAIRHVRVRDLVVAATPVNLDSTSWRRAFAIVVGALGAGLGGLLLVGDHWYWATVAALAALTGPNLRSRFTRGLQRFVGTLVGVVLAGAFLSAELPILATIVIAIVCQGLIELVILRNYGAAMLVITIIALLMVHMASPQPVGELIAHRVLETLIGVVVGLAVAVAFSVADRDPTRTGQQFGATAEDCPGQHEA